MESRKSTWGSPRPLPPRTPVGNYYPQSGDSRSAQPHHKASISGINFGNSPSWGVRDGGCEHRRCRRNSGRLLRVHVFTGVYESMLDNKRIIRIYRDNIDKGVTGEVDWRQLIFTGSSVVGAVICFSCKIDSWSWRTAWKRVCTAKMFGLQRTCHVNYILTSTEFAVEASKPVTSAGASQGFRAGTS